MAALQFSQANFIVNLLLVLALFGPIVSNLIIVGDMAVATVPNQPFVRSIAIVAGSIVILPFCLKRSTNKIWITSALSFTALVIFLSVFLYKFSYNTNQHNGLIMP